jgi:hypothetical protein
MSDGEKANYDMSAIGSKILSHKGKANQSLRFHLTPVRMAITKKTKSNKC